MANAIHWILDDASLAEHCAAWQALPFVALDTEFMRESTYWPELCLIQVADTEEAAAIDGVRIDPAALDVPTSGDRPLVIEGAGGVVTTWDGKPAQGGGRIIAAGDPRVHEAAMKLLNA